MASGDSGDSPSNAAIVVMEGEAMARRYATNARKLRMEPHVFSITLM